MEQSEMQTELVSIVVPVYNLERYLDRCVSSLVAQTYRKIEILLVDDGSTDASSMLCEAWAARDTRIRVIHKPNAGLGMARNTGIEAAAGSCICFVDGDDTVEPDLVRQALDRMKQTSADIVIFGFSDILPSGRVLRRFIPSFPETLYREDAVRRDFLPDYVGDDPDTGWSACVQSSAWSCLLSMELIRRGNWRFVSEREILSEDYYSMLELFQHVRTVAILPQALYRYHRNDASLSRSYRPDRFEKIKTFYQAYVELCCRCGYSRDVERRCAGTFLNLTVAALKQEAACCGDRPLLRIRRILKDTQLRQVLEETRRHKWGIKKRILFWTMRNGLYRCCFLLLRAQNYLTDRSGGS